MDNQSAANDASQVASGVPPFNLGGVVPTLAEMSFADLCQMALPQTPPLGRMNQADFEKAVALPNMNEFLFSNILFVMKYNDNERRIIAYQAICKQTAGKITELEKEKEELKIRFEEEKEEEKSQFEAEKKAWENEKKQLENKLTEATKTIESLEKKSEEKSKKYKKETEELKNNHKAEVKVLNSDVMRLSETVGELGKSIDAKNKEIYVLKADAETLDGLESLLKRRRGDKIPESKHSEETNVTPEKKNAENFAEISNKENMEEKPGLAAAEEMMGKPIRKRKGEKAKSGDKKQQKIDRHASNGCE